MKEPSSILKCLILKDLTLNLFVSADILQETKLIMIRLKNMTRLQKRVALVCFSRALGGLELSTIRIAQAMEKKVFPRLSLLLIRRRLNNEHMKLGFMSLQSPFIGNTEIFRRHFTLLVC